MKKSFGAKVIVTLNSVKKLVSSLIEQTLTHMEQDHLKERIISISF